MDPQLKRGMLEACALAVLARGDSYGYQMVKDVGAHVEAVSYTHLDVYKRQVQVPFFSKLFARRRSA